jgi:hypothetical protein
LERQAGHPIFGVAAAMILSSAGKLRDKGQPSGQRAGHAANGGSKKRCAKPAALLNASHLRIC